MCGGRMPDAGTCGDENGLNFALLFEEMSEAVPANAVIAVDFGNNTYSFGR